MFMVVRKKIVNNKVLYGVLDTDDMVIDDNTLEDIKSSGLKVYGVSDKGVVNSVPKIVDCYNRATLDCDDIGGSAYDMIVSAIQEAFQKCPSGKSMKHMCASLMMSYGEVGSSTADILSSYYLDRCFELFEERFY